MIEFARLTDDRRRELCIHQAAHAVIHALGGNRPSRVALPPSGGVLGALGACGVRVVEGVWLEHPTWEIVSRCLRWDGRWRTYAADRRRFAQDLRGIEHQAAADHRRMARSFICGYLAGPIAEAILTGQDVHEVTDEGRIDIHDPIDDLCVADAIARVLPFHEEFSTAVQATEDALRRPAIWAMVQTLAEQLDRVGDIEDLDGWLPRRDRRWPRSPRSSAVRATA